MQTLKITMPKGRVMLMSRGHATTKAHLIEATHLLNTKRGAVFLHDHHDNIYREVSEFIDGPYIVMYGEHHLIRGYEPGKSTFAWLCFDPEYPGCGVVHLIYMSNPSWSRKLAHRFTLSMPLHPVLTDVVESH